MDIIFTGDAIHYLKNRHKIDLTEAGLRAHLPGRKKVSLPVLTGRLVSGGVYVFSPEDLDHFAGEYKKLEKSEGRLGRIRRKRLAKST